MKRYFHLLKSFKNWRLYLAYKLGLAVEMPLLFETRNGVLVQVPERLMHTFKEIFMDECYLSGMKSDISPNAVIVDIGANAGYFTLFSISRYPDASVFAYEPIPANYKQLQYHRDLNQSSKISCFPMAVSGSCGNIEIFFDASDSFTTSATVLSGAETSVDSLRVECITLEKIFADNGIEKCDLLKMDCEGAEYDILYSCPKDYFQRIDQIAMEVHPGKGAYQNIEAMDSFLQEQGFQTCRHSDGMLWAWRG